MSNTKGPFCGSCGSSAASEAQFCGQCGARVEAPEIRRSVAFDDADLGPERGSFLSNYTDDERALLRTDLPPGPGWYGDPIVAGWARKFDGQKWVGLQRRILTDAEKAKRGPITPAPKTDPPRPPIAVAAERPRESSSAQPSADSSGESEFPGWYPDPYNPYVQRYWDGSAWTAQSPMQPSSRVSAGKSSGIAILLTILFPGLGHIYIGMSQKGMPYFVPNIVAFVVVLVLWIAFPIALLIWIFTFIPTIMCITSDTEDINSGRAQSA